MQINIEVQGGGRMFSLAIDPSETIFDLKKKVESSQKIPVERQIIIFDGEYLQDSFIISECHIHHGTCIILRIGVDYAPPPVCDSNLTPSRQPKPLDEESGVVEVYVKPPTYWEDRIIYEAELDNTVLTLKKEILSSLKSLAGFMVEGVPVERMMLYTHATGVELLDDQIIRECAVISPENRDIDVFIEEPPDLAVARKLKVKVFPVLSTEAIEIEVNSNDLVSVLKEKLEKLQLTHRFCLPANGYYFLHNLKYLFENESFHKQHVKEGDIIHSLQLREGDTIQIN